MDTKTVIELKQLNNEFYKMNASSFSDSRQSGWPGWKAVLRAMEGLASCDKDKREEHPLKVLDIACGNLRFEKYIEESSLHKFQFTCIDSCSDLVIDKTHYEYSYYDIINSLIDCDSLYDSFGIFDAAVSFGFMHHIPSYELRLQFMHDAIDSVRTGGIVAVSLWQFMNNSTLAKKAYITTDQGQARYHFDLEKNDYLIGWNGSVDAFRYCHHFCKQEIQALCNDLESHANLVSQYESDGRDEHLNTYLIFQKC